MGTRHTRNYAVVGDEIRRRILLRPLALVQDYFDPHTAIVGFDQGLGDRGRCKRRLDKYSCLGVVHFFDYGFRATAARRKVDFDCRRGSTDGRLTGGGSSRRTPAQS